MSKGTTIKEAIGRWEEKNQQKGAESVVVDLWGQIPPVEKMDASLSTLLNCEKLTLSTNCIEKIANLNGLKNLKVLSLGRNSIKSLTGLEAVGDTLVELWISYNFIEKLKGINVCKKLKVLYMSNNMVKDWGEFSKLVELHCLEDLLFVGNPLEEKHSGEGDWRDLVKNKLKKLRKLDDIRVWLDGGGRFVSKGTTIKEALLRWEEKAQSKASQAIRIELLFQTPPIEKMDASLSTLGACEMLSLSTNCIEKIANLNGLKNLKILSIGRNNIKSLAGLEAVGDTLVELWISYNVIEKLRGIANCKKLKVLYISNNNVKEWPEFQKLGDLACLEDLLFVGNPLEEKHTAEGDWRELVALKLKKLKKLDGVPVIRAEEEDAD